MEPERINGWEIWLVIYASGFALDKFATVLGASTIHAHPRAGPWFERL